ncbi:hypothetical protein HK102_001647 [Quaeritorhiza haematococci]|nr:hypothetical protein HK102_001647 [Quaeritorhiza haematococci]
MTDREAPPKTPTAEPTITSGSPPDSTQRKANARIYLQFLVSSFFGTDGSAFQELRTPDACWICICSQCAEPNRDPAFLHSLKRGSIESVANARLYVGFWHFYFSGAGGSGFWELPTL